jgi:hypothetical protein
MPYDREPILGKARDVLATSSRWPTSDGIGPTESPPLDLTVHTRGRDAAVSNPQLSIELVDEARSSTRMGGDGSGPVVEVTGLLQVAVVAGSHERLDGAGIDDDSIDVAYRLAQTVKAIWHHEAPTGLTDGSGNIEYDGVVPGQTRPLPNALRESNPAKVGVLQELNYEYTDKTPQ